MTASPRGPYVGPESFRLGETLYGRDREREELLDLVIAERIVLLYSPSGAGKTSLIQAALVPALEEAGFEVLPTIRVSHALPPEPGMPVPRNRYVMGTLLSLEQGVPPDQQRSIAELSTMSLRDYLETSADRDGRPGNELLIFDQFEEVLTADPTDEAAKHEFFKEVGQVLRDRNHWALISMREDFLAALDPYLKHIPTRFRTTFRLDLLTVPEALDAIRRPALDAGVDFPASAAQRLVDDLRTVRVQRPTGITEVLGSYVEPVQLQVACHMLWSMLSPGASEITEADVEALGQVDRALADYYAKCVRDVAGRTGVPERVIREWFEDRLITPQGLRSQVLSGPEASSGGQPDVLGLLLDAHLVRAETRRQATWYELAHDRLIEPVRRDNAAWRAENLSPLDRAAMLWEQEGKPDRLLLVGPDLAAAESDDAVREDTLSPRQREFLEASRRADELAEHERETAATLRRSARRLWIAVGVMAVFAIASVVFAVRETAARSEVAEQEQASRVLLGAQENLGINDPLAVSLAVNGALSYERELSDHARRVLYQVAQSPVEVALSSRVGEAITGAVSADDETIVLAGTETIQLWSLPDGRPLGGLELPDDTVNSVDVNEDGSMVVAGLDDGSLLVWDVDEHEQVRWDSEGDRVWQIDLSPDGTRLLAVGEDSVVRMWRLDGLDHELEQEFAASSAEAAYTATFDGDGQRVATSAFYDDVLIWEAETAELLERIDIPDEETAYALWFADNSENLATLTDTALTVWDPGSEAPVHEPYEADPYTYSYNVDADLTRILEVDPGGFLTAYDVDSQSVLAEAQASGASVSGAGFLPEPGQAIVLADDAAPAIWRLEPRYELAWATAAADADGVVFTAWDDGMLRRWDSEDAALGGELLAPVGTVDVIQLAADGTGSRLVAVSDDYVDWLDEGLDVADFPSGGAGRVWVWDAQSGAELLAVDDPVFTAAALTPDGREMMLADVDGVVSRWDVATGAQVEEVYAASDREIAALKVSDDGSMVAIAFGEAEQDSSQPAAGGDASQPDAVLVHLDDDPRAVTLALPEADDERVASTGRGVVEEAVTAIAFTPDGRRVILGTSGGRVVTFDATGDFQSAVIAHQGQVAEVTAGRSGGLVVTTGGGSADATFGASAKQVVLVDTERGEVVATVLSDEVLVTAILSDDETEITMFTEEGGVRTVPLAGDELLELVRDKLTHELTPAECDYYQIERGC